MRFETSTMIASAAALRGQFPFSLRALFDKAVSSFRGHALAAGDQIVVSATSFVSLMVIARYTNAQEVGLFALATSALGILFLVQNALVATPIFFHRHNSDVPQCERTFAGVVTSVFICLTACAAIGLVGFAFGGGTRSAIIATCAAIAALLFKEFVRDLAYADLDVKRAFILDACTAGLQLSGLFVAAIYNQLSATTALLVMTAAGTLATASALRRHPIQIVRPNGTLKRLLAESWDFGKWLVVGRFSAAAQGYIGFWICFIFAGTATTGVYAACVSIASLANPFIFGLFNFFAPRSAAVLNNKGKVGLFKSAIADTAVMGIGLLPFPLITFFFGPLLLRLTYPTLHATSTADLVTLLTVGSVISALGLPASNGLTMLEKGRWVATLSLVGVFSTAALSCVLTFYEGLLGLGVGAAAGAVIVAVSRWTVFCRAVANRHE